MKYEDAPIVSAIYSSIPNGTDNPLLEAMPPLMGKQEVFDRMRTNLACPDSSSMTMEERLANLAYLPSFFQPMDYMYSIYSRLHRAIQTTYTNQTVVASIQRLCAIRNKQNVPFATQADCGSILGVPGIGKTSTTRRCLSLMPQVITHTEYKGEKCYFKQIPWLFVECPSDCSIKSLIYNIFGAIDTAADTSILESVLKQSNNNISSLTEQVKANCLNHHVGLIVIDEIQNVVTTSSEKGQIKPLIRFLVELTNAAGTAIWMVGTPMAEDVFCAKDHLKRRTRGFRLLPMQADGVYRRLLEELWQYQYTKEKAELTDSLANLLFDRSGGIPAYLIQLFQESQAMAIAEDSKCITGKLINATAKRLAIEVPLYYKVGTPISDFSVTESCESVHKAKDMPHREFAVPRGRKPAQRDSRDLLSHMKSGLPLIDILRELEMVEIVKWD